MPRVDVQRMLRDYQTDKRKGKKIQKWAGKVVNMHTFLDDRCWNQHMKILTVDENHVQHFQGKEGENE